MASSSSSTHVRVLSTTELGSIRYKQLLSEAKWLVEFRHADGVEGSSFGAAAVDASRPKLSVKSCSSSFALTESLVRAPRGEWRLLAKIPAGEIQYSIGSGQATMFEGTCCIDPPDAPLENSFLASSLKARTSSGAVQQSCDSSAIKDGMWPVDFVFNENVVGVKDVYVVLKGSETDVKCSKEEGDGGRDKYVATALLGLGQNQYRFRVVFREAQNAQSTSLTRLGYDSGFGGVSHSTGLVTWELALTVVDLSTGAKPELYALDHEKGGLSPSSIALGEASPRTEGIISGLSVKGEKDRLEEMHERKNVRGPPMEADPVPGGLGNQASSESKFAIFVASACGVGISVLLALALLAASRSRQEMDDDDDGEMDEDDDGTQRIRRTIRRCNS